MTRIATRASCGSGGNCGGGTRARGHRVTDSPLGLEDTTMIALDALARDARYGLRRMARDWGFTAAAVLILGLAIGANTAIFSLVNAVLFRQPSVAAPERLVNIYQNDTAGRPLVVTSVLGVRGDGGLHQRLFGDDGRQHPQPRPLSPRWGRGAARSSRTRRPRISTCSASGRRSAGGSPIQRSAAGLPPWPSSDIRRGPRPFVPTRRSSDASFASRAWR